MAVHSLQPRALLGFLILTTIALLPLPASAVEPSSIPGTWAVSTESPQTPREVDLQIDRDSDRWKATLRSAAGTVTTDRVNLQDDRLTIRYGTDALDVRLEWTIDGTTMRGTLVTGAGDAIERQPITAKRLPKRGAKPTQDQSTPATELDAQTGEFLGAWDVSLQWARAEQDGTIRLGMVVAESDGNLLVGHNGFDRRGPQKRIDRVRSTDDGLRWILDGGVFGPLNVDLARQGDKLRVEVRGADESAFLKGTAVSKAKPEDIGIDREQLLQKPGTELVGMIRDARVVEVADEWIILQQRDTVLRIFKNDPFLVPTRWFRLPEKSRLIAVDEKIAWSMTGTTIRSWTIRDTEPPLELASCEIPGNAPTLVRRWGDKVFAANWNGVADTQQIQTIDLSDPGAPRFLGSHDTPKGLNHYDLEVANSRIYLASADGLRIAEVTERQVPTIQSHFKGKGRWVRGVDVVGSTAFIATSMHGDASWLQIIDVSDPTAPVEAGLYQSTGGAQDVAVSEDVAFLADRADGMVVLNVKDPQHPRRIGYFRTQGRANRVDLLGKLAFVAVLGDTGSRTLNVIRYIK